MSNLLRAKDVVIERAGRAVVNGLSLDVKKSECIVLLGPNGAGKSLTLKALHGLIAPQAGEIYRGLEIGPKGRALLFQRPELLRRSVRANLAYPLKHHKVAGRKTVIDQVLAAHGLTSLAKQRADHLSGGEAQRVAIARAAVLQPRLLMLDEPTTALDPTAAAKVEEMIGALNEDGTAILMTTHDLAQARRMAKRVIFMKEGRVLEDAEAPIFFERPRSAEAQAFLAGQLS